MKAGDTVVVRCPAEGSEPETWLRGKIQRTVAREPGGAHAVHVVRVRNFKWDKSDPWGPYTGVPEVLARETRGRDVLVWIDGGEVCGECLQ